MSIRIACHGITWGRYGFATAIQEISALGFTGFEAFAFVVDDFGFDRLGRVQTGALRAPTEARSSVRRRRFAPRGPLRGDGRTECTYRPLPGGQRCRPAGAGPGPAAGRRSQPRRSAELRPKCANEIGRRVAEYGVLACAHPHVNTVIERKDEIDLLMERTDPRYVAMAADTAHLPQG